MMEVLFRTLVYLEEIVILEDCSREFWLEGLITKEVIEVEV